MNLLFKASDAAFEQAALSDERCDAMLARQRRLRRGGVIAVLVLLLLPMLFFGALIIGDPFKSPVWHWLLSPDSIHARTNEIQFGGYFLIGLICGAIGLVVGADYQIKLLLSIRALKRAAATRPAAEEKA